MARMRFTPRPNHMSGTIGDVPTFPGDQFGLNCPEAIGDMARGVWLNRAKPQWRELDNGVWENTGSWPNEMSFSQTITPGEDTLDVRIRLTNKSKRTWVRGMAFNCFSCGSSPSIRDYECLRHWARTGGEFKRLIEIPRTFSPRPTIQLYSVEGQPRGQDIPFVANFKATPDAVLEGWLAIQARDGKRLVAVVSKPALFLFQNMEYSCIHSGPSFGPMEPGETREALTRCYFVEATLGQWYERMKAELHV